MAATLSTQEVHVWYCLAEDPPWPDVESSYLALLTTDELGRYHRFMFDKDRRQFLLARALVRTVLSCYASPAPNAWEFSVTELGKPHVAARFGLPHLQFNHSHADALVACAVTNSHAVGVDVESTARTVDPAIARYCLSSTELQHFHSVNASAQQTFLIQQWTLKEAYSKARGLGLSLPFVDVTITMDVQGSPTLAHPVAGDDDPQAWQFHQWLIEARHYLAVAVHRPVDKPCRFVLHHSIPPLGPARPPESAA